MKRFYVVMLLFFVISSNSNAQNKWGLTAGVHYARFYDVKVEPRPGFSLGLERSWSLNNSTFIQSGLIYSNRSSILEDKTIGWSGFWDNDINLWNINCTMHYLSLPIQLKKQIVKFSNYSFFSTFGILINCGILDGSKRSFIKTLYYWGQEKPQIKFDYEATYELGPFHSLENSTISWDWGLGFEKQNYSFIIYMNFDVLGEVKSIPGAFLHHQFATLGVLTTFYF